MPRTKVVIYKDDDGRSPLLDWLTSVQPQEAVPRCLALIERLGQSGHELRRPAAAPLRDGIHELRTRVNRVRVRMLYFFDKKTAVLTHGFVKVGDKVPDVEIERAMGFRDRSQADPVGHTHEEGGS